MARSATARATVVTRPQRSGPPRTRTGRPAPAPRRRAQPARPRVVAAPTPRRVASGVAGRLLGGRAWIACTGLLLAGVVAANVAVLQLNGTIAQTGKRSAELKRENAALRGQLAKLGSTERIQKAAADDGLVLPAPGEVRYLSARGELDAQRAAITIKKPTPPVAAAPAVTPEPLAATQPPTATEPPAATAQPPATTEPQAAPAPHAHPPPAAAPVATAAPPTAATP